RWTTPSRSTTRATSPTVLTWCTSPGRAAPTTTGRGASYQRTAASTTQAGSCANVGTPSNPVRAGASGSRSRTAYRPVRRTTSTATSRVSPPSAGSPASRPSGRNVPATDDPPSATTTVPTAL